MEIPVASGAKIASQCSVANLCEQLGRLSARQAVPGAGGSLAQSLIAKLAATGVDWVLCRALTHAAPQTTAVGF